MSECDVCNNFQLLKDATCNEKAFNWNVLKSLCYIIELLSAEEETSTPVTNVLPQVVKTAAQIESSYTTFTSVGLISSIKQLNAIRVVNNTDCGLEFSYDGGDNVAFTVLANTEYKEELNMSFSQSTALQMQKVSGETAGFGSVLIEGRYNS